MELYQWQKNCLRAWEENRFRGIVHAVTGSGKTTLALSAIDLLRERCPDLRVRIVVPTVALAQQWKTALLHHAPTEALRPGFFGGSVRDDPDGATMLYIINSARGALAAHIRRDITLRRHSCWWRTAARRSAILRGREFSAASRFFGVFRRLTVCWFSVSASSRRTAWRTPFAG